MLMREIIIRADFLGSFSWPIPFNASDVPMKNTPFRKTAVAVAVAAATCQVHANDEPQLEEIVIRGGFQQSLVNRIPITQQELPFTLNVLDRDFLDARNFTRPIEALTTLPNITRAEDRQGTGTARFLSRGFEAPILVDNRLQNNFRGAGARDDSFIERYEVLKGPASITLGPIAPGGAINAVTKTPEEDRFYAVELRTDQFGTVSGEFDANLGELGSNVLFRVSGAYSDFEFDADETKRRTVAIRPVVVANLGSATSVRASVAYTENDVNPNLGFPLLSNGDVPSQIDTDTFTGFDNGKGEAEDTSYDVELKHDFLDNLTLTLRGSKQDTDFDYQNTSGLYNYNYADGGPGLGLNDPYVYSYTGGGETESEVTFYDVQLAYRTEFWGQAQDFVVGLVDEERSFERFFSRFPSVGPFRVDNLDEPRFGPSDIGSVFPNFGMESDLHSRFLEAAIRPNDWVTIVTGVRYDKLKQNNFRRGENDGFPFDDSELTYRLGASAEVAEGINLYASFAESFNSQFGERRDDDPAVAETSEGIELGVKGSVLDNRMSFEVGYFSTERENVAVRDPNNVPGEFFVVSVGKVDIDGYEFTGNINPIDGLNITANIGLIDVDVEDDDIPATIFPEETGSLYVRYQLQSGGLEGLSIGGGLRYVGDREGPVVDFDSYTIADINIAYEFSDGIVASLDILNANDEFYVENSASFAQNLTAGSVLGAPRTAVLTLRAKFD